MRTYSVKLTDGTTKTIRAIGFQAALRRAIEQYGDTLADRPRRVRG